MVYYFICIYGELAGKKLKMSFLFTASPVAGIPFLTKEC